MRLSRRPLAVALLALSLLPLGGCDDDAAPAVLLPPLVDNGGGNGGGGGGSGGNGGGGGDTVALVDVPPPDYWPSAGWQAAAPESRGFAAGALDDLAADAASALPDHTSLLVIKDGYLVFESYRSPDAETLVDAGTRHDIFSVTKSVMSLVMGTAWQRGDLLPADLSSTVDDHFAPLITNLPARANRRDVTLLDALQMRSGIRWNDAWNFSFSESPMFRTHPGCAAGDTITLCTLLRRAESYTPGKVWNYSTWDSYLASAFFTSITGSSLRDYAGTHLFAPLGIDFASEDWMNWPRGSSFSHGGAFLTMTSRDLARLGMLVLHNGAWDGQQLVARSWLEAAWTPIGSGQIATYDAATLEPAAPVTGLIPYSRQWWLASDMGLPADQTINAHGLGGQLVHVDPAHNLVVVITTKMGDTYSPFTEYRAFIAAEITGRLAD